NSQKQEIFERAMASDRESYSLIVGGDDFVSMIVRFWQQFPAAIILGAIHQVLEEAKADNSPISVFSPSTNVSFSSAYDYRLFELLPILRELDREEAEKLQEKSFQIKAQLQRLSNGLQSLDPTIRDTALNSGEHSEIRGMVGVQN